MKFIFLMLNLLLYQYDKLYSIMTQDEPAETEAYLLMRLHS